jgi:hypothetical protein
LVFIFSLQRNLVQRFFLIIKSVNELFLVPDSWQWDPKHLFLSFSIGRFSFSSIFLLENYAAASKHYTWWCCSKEHGWSSSEKGMFISITKNNDGDLRQVSAQEPCRQTFNRGYSVELAVRCSSSGSLAGRLPEQWRVSSRSYPPTAITYGNSLAVTFRFLTISPIMRS